MALLPGEWLSRSAYGASTSASISRILIAREKSTAIAHSNCSKLIASAGASARAAIVSIGPPGAASSEYDVRRRAANSRASLSAAEPWRSASSASLQMKLAPTSAAVLGSTLRYGAQKEAAPSARSRISSSASVSCSPSAGVAMSAPRTATALRRVMHTFSGTRKSASPCRTPRVARRPRPDGCRSWSLVCDAMPSGWGAAPHDEVAAR
mmetsp:Transcript_20525/g.63812  ORF Transcript_20525/g.63812 Transcript_20525/m.63812 type:complete len:209 (-) Transcript_20525:88-714(-)